MYKRQVYDPANPVPTVGGPLCCDSVHLAPGPRDQKEVESRADVLIYSTPPLDHDTEVTGLVTLDLFAQSSAADTDFTAKLIDVGPDGFAQNLTEGILRARYRESTSEAKPIVPGKIYEYKIDMWSTSNVFLKGHRIRVEAVSYTHLEREAIHLNGPEARELLSLYYQVKGLPEADSMHMVNHIASDPEQLLRALVSERLGSSAVSYTHLFRHDRQRPFDGLRRLPGGQERA